MHLLDVNTYLQGIPVDDISPTSSILVLTYLLVQIIAYDGTWLQQWTWSFSHREKGVRWMTWKSNVPGLDIKHTLFMIHCTSSRCVICPSSTRRKRYYLEYLNCNQLLIVKGFPDMLYIIVIKSWFTYIYHSLQHFQHNMDMMEKGSPLHVNIRYQVHLHDCTLLDYCNSILVTWDWRISH